MEEEKNVFYVHMLGDLSFRYGQKVFSIKCADTSKVMQLLLLLLQAKDEGIPRVQLLEFLYGNEEMQDAKNAFRILVFRLRKLLEETVLPKDNYVCAEKGIYFFGGRLSIETDAGTFEQRAEKVFQIEDKEKRADAIKLACEVYSGEFLPLLEEEWAVEERIRYKKKYFQCVLEGCRLMRESKRYEELLNLCNNAAKIYPYEEWQLVQIDCLLAMNQYTEALHVYEEATALFFEEMGSFGRTEKMLERFRTMSRQIHYSMGTIEDIKDSLKEKELTPGAYYCSYPSFIDSYRVISRAIERSGQSIFLMLCTITDNRGNPIDKDEVINEQAAHLSQAIGKALRRGDLYTRYSPNQFLVLLMGIDQEDCEITFNRICMRFRELCPGQRVQIRYYVSSIAEVKNSKVRLRFGDSANRWKRNGS